MKQQIPKFGLNFEQLVLIRDALKAEYSLHEFVKQAWPVIEGKNPFIDGWHIGAICEHLEAVANRQIKNLLINIPPRCCKSTLVSIAFPAWVWINKPHERFFCASYARSLSNKHSSECRRLITSSWYQDRWGDRYYLMKDQNAKSRFDNSKRGYRVATSVSASVTGEGGSIIIVDDPHNVKDGSSDVKREATVIWWSQSMSTRLNDKKNDCRIVVQQRVHEGDVAAYIQANDDNKEWVKLILPMEYEETRRSKTIVLPSTNGKIWEDFRVKEGELLWPEIFDKKTVESLKKDLGAYATAGQLQQRPSPEGGGIIKKEWFKWWKDATPPEIQFVVQSWDTAYSIKKHSAYSACTTWGVFYDHNYIENAILLSMWKGRVEYIELREMAKRLYFDYRDTGKEHNPAFNGKIVDICLIEAKANGDPLMKDLRSAGIVAIPFNPTPYKFMGTRSKEARAHLITPLIEGGRVWLPARAPLYNKLLPYAEEFLEEAAAFPSLESNDIVDTMTQALIKLKEGLLLFNSKDPRPEPTFQREISIY